MLLVQSSSCPSVGMVQQPNARRELLLKAGARYERTMEAVSSTPLLGAASARLPCLDLQTVHFMKMPITGHQGELILHGNRSNPDIVFGNRSALGTQLVFDVPVLLGGGRVAWQDRTTRDKFINAGEILCDTRGLVLTR